jgi:hypothetical protein
VKAMDADISKAATETGEETMNVQQLSSTGVQHPLQQTYLELQLRKFPVADSIGNRNLWEILRPAAKSMAK